MKLEDIIKKDRDIIADGNSIENNIIDNKNLNFFIISVIINSIHSLTLS